MKILSGLSRSGKADPEIISAHPSGMAYVAAQHLLRFGAIYNKF